MTQTGSADTPARAGKASGHPAKGRGRSKSAQPQRGEARQCILDTACDLVADFGFDAVSTADIAKLAGVSQSVILYHFATKEDLWRQAMQAIFARAGVLGGLDMAAFQDATSVTRFEMLLRRFVQVSARVPQLGRVLNREALSGGARLHWLVHQLAMPQYRLFIEVIGDLQREGHMAEWDPVSLTLAIHGAGATIYNMHPLVAQLSDGDVFDDTAIAQQTELMIAVFMQGVLGKA